MGGPAKQEQQKDGKEEEEPFLRFRLTYLDTVQSSPLSLPPPPTAFDKSTPFIPARRIPFAPPGSNIQIDRVPELRIFGATEAGQRCCVHVHGALPYVYVEYEGKVHPDDIHSYINRLARAINVCMAASLNRRDPAKSLFVAFVVPVKAVPFYGFHVGYRYFLKIYTLDPKYMTRLATVLRSGEIMKKKFIVYESHIPFLLQFMLDANLYGCGWVDISKAKFREPVPEDEDVVSSGETASSHEAAIPMAAQTEGDIALRRRKPKIYTRTSIPDSMMYGDPVASPPRIAHSVLEFDIHVSWILNRHRIKERNLHADFTEYLDKPIPDDFKFVHSVRELWEDEKRRRKQRGLDGPMEVSENSAEELLGGLTAGPRSIDNDVRMFGIGTQPPWKTYSESQVLFDGLVAEDQKAYAKKNPGRPSPDYQTFAKKERKGGFMEKIRTSFQSVEALFEETMVRDEEEENPFGAWSVKGIGVSVGRGGRERTADVDVNPHYLAALATQAGRAKLQRLEEEDARLDALAGDAGLDEGNVHSDEEETHAEGQKRDIEEAAKEIAKKPGVSRETAWQEELAARNEDGAEGGVPEDYQDLPPLAQGPAQMRRSESNGSKTESEYAGSKNEGPMSRDGSIDGHMFLDLDNIAAEDADVALLDQLMPTIKDEEEADTLMQLDNSPPTSPGLLSSTYGTILSNGPNGHSQSALLHVLPKTEENDNRLPFVTRTSSASPVKRPLPSSPTKAALGFYSPGKKRDREQTPVTTTNALAPTSPRKSSPSKPNYFSPAKSKLRNAVINPNFVAEAKAKRSREEQMIGFRAIGDHGRTKLQQMLNISRQPKEING